MKFNGGYNKDMGAGKQRKPGYLLDTFLGPLKIPLGLTGNLDAVREIGAGTFQAALSECLQLKKLSLLRVQLAGPVEVSSVWILLVGSYPSACV